MKKQNTFQLVITADTYIKGEPVKAGSRVEVDGDDAFLLTCSGKAKATSVETKK